MQISSNKIHEFIKFNLCKFVFLGGPGVMRGGQHGGRGRGGFSRSGDGGRGGVMRQSGGNTNSQNYQNRR